MLNLSNVANVDSLSVNSNAGRINSLMPRTFVSGIKCAVNV